MRKLLFLFLIIVLPMLSCEDNGPQPDCGTHNGKQLYQGPRGGCYYINSNNNKTYVDRSECDC
ncbi:hypothetical protein PEDI_38230 [Persicobacter diffluens]|uniref:Lipoprotein n=1 Tax=Persicobacter diffluens TaxID=981 RepID=A0AAN4W218_9BACT|nr:hypothetical protein PEDI_38230 [Persicobacter diffluens]